MWAAVDLGITNIDIVFQNPGGYQHARLNSSRQPILEQLGTALQSVSGLVERAAVTGGRYRSLPDLSGTTQLVKINEVNAIGRGGLYLSGLEEALVVSAGSGTAMVAARAFQAAHVTGSAVGGGTLQGLAQLLLGTTDPFEIDRLAMQGDANRADLTLVEAVGERVGTLPLDANAVNFGRLAREQVNLTPPDLAAGLVRLVGQVIAVIAINAARAEHLEWIVITGHLVDLPSLRKVLNEVAGYYDAKITVPANPGIGTAIGAMLCLEDEQTR